MEYQNDFDTLVVFKTDGTVAAKVTIDGRAKWLNDGIVSGNRVHVSGSGHSVKLEIDRDAVEKFRNGEVEENMVAPHHRIVCRGRVNDERVVGFFDTEGRRIGLKRALETEAAADTARAADLF